MFFDLGLKEKGKLIAKSEIPCQITNILSILQGY